MKAEHLLRPDADQKGSSFEEAVFVELHNLLAELEPGRAKIDAIPNHLAIPRRYAVIRPSLSSAAQVIVGVVSTDLHLTIGEVEQEFIAFKSGGLIIPCGTWLDDLRWIWNAVTRCKFKQVQYLSANGDVIGGASVLRWNGFTFDFRGGRVAESLFSSRKSRLVVFDPY